MALMCAFHRSSAVLPGLLMYASLCLGLFTSLLIILFYFDEVSLRSLEFLLLIFFSPTGPYVTRANP